MKTPRNKEVIVAVGGHPDDYEYGCGASLAKHVREGYKVTALIMTDGKLGGHHPNMAEAKRAKEILGIHELHFGNFPDGALQVNSKSIAFLREYIIPGVRRVYGPIADDEHPDHVNTALAVQIVAPGIVPEILFYEGPRNRTFNPRSYVEVTQEELEKKVAAYENYLSQSKRGSLFHDVKPLAHVRGIRSRSSTGLAEAFEVYRMVC